MDPDREVDFDMSPFLIRYKSGRVHRLMGGASRVNAGTDTATGVTSKDVVIDAGLGLAARLFIPTDVLASKTTPPPPPPTAPKKKLPILVYFHGGGFVVRSAFSAVYTRFVNALVSAARVVAVSVEYRLAPEHPLPAAYHDAWAALSWAAAAKQSGEPWLADHGDAARLFVAGDSAGGNIAHNVAMAAGKKKNKNTGGGVRIEIEGMVLLHPYFGGTELLPSEGEGVYPNFRQTPEQVWSFLCAGRYGMDHPFINPLATPAADWAALPCRRVMVTVAERDYTRDRGRRYVEALRRGGFWPGEEAALYETEGEDHIYFLEKARSSRQQDKVDKEMAAIASFVRASSSSCEATLRRPSASGRSRRLHTKL